MSIEQPPTNKRVEQHSRCPEQSHFPPSSNVEGPAAPIQLHSKNKSILSPYCVSSDPEKFSTRPLTVIAGIPLGYPEIGKHRAKRHERGAAHPSINSLLRSHGWCSIQNPRRQNNDPISCGLVDETNVPSPDLDVACLWEFRLEYKISEKLREVYIETLEEIELQTGENGESKAISLLANAFGDTMVDFGLALYGDVCVSRALHGFK